MIYTMLNHLDYNELLSIGFLMSAKCAYSRKCSKVFYTNLWVDFFLIQKYQEKTLDLVSEIDLKDSAFKHFSGNYH